MYQFSTTLNCTHQEAVEKVTEALKTESFGVLTEIDVQATFKAKLDIDRKPYRILGACNPALANQAITADADIGLLLPCNILIRENDDASQTVAFLDPVAMFSVVERDDMVEFVEDVQARLKKVMALLV